MLDGPDMIEAKLIGDPTLFEGAVVDGPLHTGTEGPRRREFEEDAEFHLVYPAVFVAFALAASYSGITFGSSD